MEAKNNNNLLEKIVSLCKRRGLVFQGSEIYGGIESIYDYGPVGVLIKNNIKKIWWKEYVEKRSDMVGLDSAILMNPAVWRASGHLSGFNDLMVECLLCRKRFRVDHLLEDLGFKFKNDMTYVEEILAKNFCPQCQKGKFGKVGTFNMMFKTFFGPYEKTENIVYLRPETAQGIFVNFKNILDSYRLKLPFGIAQIGKAFRNEITTGNFLFRLREFEQMEIEWFTKPQDAQKDYKYWQKERLSWYQKIGLSSDKLRIRKHQKYELAHYAKASCDIEYKFTFGWKEIEGIANRTDFDLKNHSQEAKQELTYFDDHTKKAVIPYVIEPSCGVDRIFLALLTEAYCEEKVKGRKRVYLKLTDLIAPFKVAVFPLLSNNEELVNKAHYVYELLKDEIYPIIFDDSGSIGKRYRRIDEIGVPYALTIDHLTLTDNTVTIRHRDSMKQERLAIKDLTFWFKHKFKLS